MDTHDIVLRIRNAPSLDLWTRNPAGGSDYWNGDERNIINSIPSSWQRAATALHSEDTEGKVAWIEIRAEFDKHVNEQYAENETLQFMDPQRDVFRLLGPLERPQLLGPWKPEVKQIVQPTSIPSCRESSDQKTPDTWPYKQYSMIPEPKPRLDIKYKQYQLDEFYCDPERIQRRNHTPFNPASRELSKALERQRLRSLNSSDSAESKSEDSE
ncbi:hypothetical protein KCU65_g8633, partial [Aureobasidium melanogenum]